MALKDLISVIVPVYKVEQYLEKCIHSVTKNTHQNLEVICIDDGGLDTSGVILDRLAKEDNRIIVLHQENKGVAIARNKGLEIASGEYVAFVDSDDYIHPAMFKTMIECIQSMGASIVTCRADRIKEGIEAKHVESKDIQFHQLNAESFFESYYARHMVWGRLYRKLDLEGQRFSPDVRYGEDTLFNLCVITRIPNPIVYETTAPLYYYLMRDSSISHTHTYDIFMDFGNWYNSHRAESVGCGSSWKWMLPMQVIKMTLSYRFYAIIEKNEKRLIKMANQILHSCYFEIVKDPAVSLKQKVLHAIMIISPAVYEAFRINNDPTLKLYGKKARKKPHIFSRGGKQKQKRVTEKEL